MKSMENKTTGAEEIHWDLSDLYLGIDDPVYFKDQKNVLQSAQSFAKQYRGRIAELDATEFLGLLKEYEAIKEIAGKVGSFSYLLWSTNTQDAAYGKAVQSTNELGSKLSQLMVFFRVEWLALDENEAQRIINDPVLAEYTHYLESSRSYKPYSLSEGQEQILSAKSVTGQSAWIRYFDETLGSATFRYAGKDKSEQEVFESFT